MHEKSRFELEVYDSEYLVRDAENFAVHVERLISDVVGSNRFSVLSRGYKVDVMCSFEIEGWIDSGTPTSEVRLVSVIGHREVVHVIDSSNLSRRPDLEGRRRYFVLTVPLSNVLFKNHYIIRLCTQDGLTDVFTFKLNVKLKDQFVENIKPIKFLSIVTAGRSGSTLLGKMFGCTRSFCSLSSEEEEHTFLASSLKYFFSSLSLKSFDRGSAFDGDKEHFFSLPYISSSPIRHLYDYTFLRELFSVYHHAAMSYYVKAGCDDGYRPVIVEKVWLSPIFSMESWWIGVKFIVLVRNPFDLANSIKSYYNKKHYDIGFDPNKSDELILYVEKICSALLWYKRYLPNAIDVRYEDLFHNTSSEFIRILIALGCDQDECKAFEKKFSEFDYAPKKSHSSGEFMLSVEEMAAIRDKCGDFINFFHYD
jgi:hypothetical protein